MVIGSCWRHSPTGRFYVVVGTARLSPDASGAILFREIGAPLSSPPWVIPERCWLQRVRLADGSRAIRYEPAE